ncbi:IS110 family transposase [Sulfurimonas sp. MAG313]|nr:IS110 family transposase [Sulfurimonas sp. MAG313]MDF1880061.1 IS110 family transposase [Sulfurimonas sp. MAG313]
MTAFVTPKIIKIGIDVGSQNHSVAMMDAYGNVLPSFDIDHTNKGFDKLFKIIENEAKKENASVEIAMEGYNGWARPLDGFILDKGYKLFNINNMKLARFKEIFPAAAKTDAIDASKILELFSFQNHLPLAKEVLQEVIPSSENNIILKKLSRRRKQLVEEKIALTNRFGSDLQAVAPDLKNISLSIENLWFLRFFTLRDDLRHLVKLHRSTIEGIKHLGPMRSSIIAQWKKQASFSNDVQTVASMLYDDAVRILQLKEKIKDLEAQMKVLVPHSKIARLIETIPGFATVTASELAGEIGNIERFKSERSLALYVGMTNLDNSSGKRISSKRSISTNRHAKMAMLTATMKHTQHVEESKIYLAKKIAEGKRYQQGIRSMGRHLIRVIWNMIQNDRAYEIR